MSEIKRTLIEVLDCENGEIILADSFFKLSESEVFLTRKRLERAIQKKDEPKFICFYCKQLITIVGKPSGEGKKIKYFKHLKDSKDCHYKTNGNFTKNEVLRMKYNGAKESILHIKLKNFIAERLQDNQTIKGEVNKIKIEKVFKDIAISKEWKKPDVSATFNNSQFVFELQLSTTFLSEIVKREDFYFKNNAYILWIFHNFEEKSDLQKFTQKDIIYSNKRNAFVLSEEAQEKSLEAKDLVLECYYQVPDIINNEIFYKWEKVFVKLSDLKLDEKAFRLYYFDSDFEFEKLENWLELEKKQRLEEKKIEENNKLSKNIQKALELFREFYQTGQFHYVEKIIKELEILNENERELLFYKINVQHKNKPLLFHLLESNEKYFFTNNVFNINLFPINVNLEWNNKSVIESLYFGDKSNFDKSELYNRIYQKGYNAKLHNDIKFLNSELSINQNNLDKLADIYNLRNIIFLNDFLLIIQYNRYSRVFLAFQSIQISKIIGSKLKNLIALSNNFLEHYPQFGDKYIKFLKVNGEFENLLTNDKKETFKNKLREFQNKKPFQITDFDAVFAILFPDCI